MSRSPSVMVVANHFPPVAAAGTHRIAGLCRYLAEQGWQVTVITAAPSKETTLDQQLLDNVPDAVRVVRTAAPDLPLIMARILKRGKSQNRTSGRPRVEATQDCPLASASRVNRALKWMVDWLSWWLHIPDGRTGWFFPAFWTSLREGMRHRPDVIFSSAPVWTAHMVATALSYVLRVPLVADFRDPWCGSAFRSIPYRCHRYVNGVLENSVVRRAQKITCAWDGIRRHLVKSYPNRTADISTVLNGFDPTAIDSVEPIRLQPDAHVFLHTGSFYGPRSPEPLFCALKELYSNGNAPREKVVVCLVGASQYHNRNLIDFAREFHIEDHVCVVGPVPHKKSIAFLRGADSALLCGQSGSDDLASIPAKTYEYIGACKPVLAVGAGEEVCEVMRQGGCPVWSAPADNPSAIAAAMREMVQRKNQADKTSQARSRRNQKFTRANMAARLEEVMCTVIGGGSQDRM